MSSVRAPRRASRRLGRAVPFTFLILACLISTLPPLSAQTSVLDAPPAPAERREQPATVGIAPLSQAGGPNTGVVAKTVVDTVETVLRMTGRFEPVLLGEGRGESLRPGPDGTVPDGETLRAVADQNDLDNLIIGSISTDTDGRTIIELQSYNRHDDALTVEISETAPNLFSVFDAVDRAVVALLEGFTGTRVAFGTLTLSGDWQPERDQIALDGTSYEVRGSRVAGILAREYLLTVTRRESDGGVTRLLEETVRIEPDGSTTVTIPLRRVTIGSVEVVAARMPQDQELFDRSGADLPAAVALAPPPRSTEPRGNAIDLGYDLAGENLVIYNIPIGYDAVIEAFEAETGVRVVRAPEVEPNWRLDLALQAEEPPQIAFTSQPGPAFDLLDLEIVDNLYRVFDRPYLEHSYRRDILAFGHPDPVAYEESDRSVGLTTSMSLKSLYWYAPSLFPGWSLSGPADRAEMALSITELRRTGQTPYSFAIESGESSGWMVTDWIEDRLLQTIPLELYDAWSRGQLSFRNPAVERVVTRTIRQIRRNGEMFGGIEGVGGRPFSETLSPLVAQPPRAGVAFGASFLAQWHMNDLDRLEFFGTPPNNPANGTRRLVGGDMVILVEATAAARGFIRFLNTPEAARLLAESLAREGQIGRVVAHNAAVPELYEEPQRSFARIIRDADHLRYDASDRMSREVGMERFFTGSRSMVYGADITGTLTAIDRYRRATLR